MSYKPRAAPSGQRALISSRPLILAISSLVALAGISCGKVGAPVPPTRITERTSDLSAVQRGGTIRLTWPAPPLVQSEASRSYIARADVYRLIEQRGEEPVLDPDDYEELAEVVGYLDRATIEAQLKGTGQLQYTDNVSISRPEELANIRVRYAVRYVNKRGQAATFSNTVALEPVPGVALAAGNLRLDLQAQDAIAISWDPPEANIDGTRPASVVGYNIYRRRARRDTYGEPLNPEPLTDLTFTDRGFQYQASYIYVVRALSQGARGLVESADSAPLSVTPVDTFKPAAPDPVSVASTNAVISLFWPTSPERDVVGYNVYRADSGDASEKDWTKLNKEPLTTVTYRDDRVALGQRYYYRITAVDKFNNESEPSKVVSETANP